MQVFIIASMCVINLVLWLVFFVKFKKLFTTENEIQKTREQYELLVNDINRNTLNNINLIDSKIEELNEIADLASRRIQALQEEENFKSAKSSVKSTLRKTAVSSQSSSKKIQSQKENIATKAISKDAAFEVNIKKRPQKKQADLFEPEIPSSSKVHYMDENGNAYGQVPIMSPKIYMSDTPLDTKKSFNTQVRELFELGLDATEIAHKLKKSTTEVQFVIDMIL